MQTMFQLLEFLVKINKVYKFVGKGKISMFPKPNARFNELRGHLLPNQIFLFLGEFKEIESPDFLNLKILYEGGIAYLYTSLRNYDFLFEEVE